MDEQRLYPSTIGEAAYRRIRSDIIFGRLRPGQRLKLDVMKEVYGASVTTLRETFNRLSSQGFVLAEGSRGFEVAPTSATNLHETAAMRLLLEGHALRLSFQAGNVRWEADVVASYHLLKRVEESIGAGEPSEIETWKQRDCAFHRALISACGSTTLLEMHELVQDKYFRYVLLAAVFRGKVAFDEHRILLDCAMARDWELAQHTLERHVQGCVAQMVDHGFTARGRSS